MTTEHRRPSPAPVGPPPLPQPRGPISEALLAHLARPGRRVLPRPEDGPLDDDGQLALHCCYELTYRGFAGVDDELEWDSTLLRLRAALEQAFVADLRAHVAPPPDGPAETIEHLRAAAAPASEPGLSGTLAVDGTLQQLREVFVHRSAYQLKEADPHTWGIPRLTGEAKAAMVEIQADEYGGGRRADMHSELFALTMAEAGLDPSYGAYLDLLPGITLATGNLISLFGLHRRWRGALVGHLALFEMTSIEPMGRYAAAVDRLLGTSAARRFYDVHVEADAHHQEIALHRMVAGFLADEPERCADVAFGADALVVVEGRFTDHVLGAWAAGRSSLVRPPSGRAEPPGCIDRAV